MKASIAAAVLGTAILATPALSATIPVADPATAGTAVTVTTSGEVFATYLGWSGTYAKVVSLNGVEIFSSLTSVVGTTVSLGYYDAGSVLTFSLYVPNTGKTYFSGAASQNSDGLAHAAVEVISPTETLVSFEALHNGKFGPYNLGSDFADFAISLTTNPAQVPLPASGLVLLAALGATAAVRRRKA